tara:strand:+ start:110 stop:910 length:801 start_codon:yes stop_codon:yes gene_type:complete
MDIYDARHNFYLDIVKESIPLDDSTILICGGGILDKQIFQKLKFRNVTITNVDERTTSTEFLPYNWEFQDVQKLTYKDNSFDYVVIHDAIHHCSMPHNALIELFRVAKKGILGFESRDSFVMKILERLKLTQTYEHAAVFYNNCSYGGVNNTEIPNYVYRWTEREIEKTINTYSPCYNHKFIYRYGSAFPATPVLEARANLKMLFLKIMLPFYKIFKFFFKKQQNLFAFYIEKPTNKSTLKPWLNIDIKNNISFNRQWGEKKYKTK